MANKCRVDLSDLHAYQARQQYALEVQKGESGINLAAAALAVSAEDDALVSHSTVKLPEETFLKRIDVFSAEVQRSQLSNLPSDVSPLSILEASAFRSGDRLIVWRSSQDSF